VSFKKKYVENLKSIFQENAHDRGSRLVLSGLYFGASALIYILAVYVPDDETKETLADPQGVLAHFLVFLASGASVVVFFMLVIGIVTFCETEWCSARLSWFGSFLGMSNSPRAFKQALRTLRAMDREQVSLSTAIPRYKQAGLLLKTVNRFDAEPPHTIAKARAERLARRVIAAELSARAALRSDELYAQARLAVLGSAAPSGGSSSKDEEWCYVSVSGNVRHPAALVLLARFQIAGPDPFGMSDRLWDDGLASDEYGFSALLLAPRWVCESAFTGNDTDSYVTPRTTEPVAACGTYKDTVAALWRPDRWSKYHEPERLVNAARRLDSHRKDGEEFKVAF